MAIEFNCPECRQLMKAGEEYAGKKARCPSCMGVVSVPLRSTMDRAVPPADAPDEQSRSPGDSRPPRRVDADRPDSRPDRPRSFDRADPEPTRRRGPMPRWDEDEDEHRAGRRPDPQRSSGGPRTRPCPMCGEAISVRARRCGFCGETYDDEGRVGSRSPLAYGVVDHRGSAISSMIVGGITLPLGGIMLASGVPWICMVPFGPIGAFLGIWNGIRGLHSSLRGLAIAGLAFNALSLLMGVAFAIVRLLTV